MRIIRVIRVKIRMIVTVEAIPIMMRITIIQVSTRDLNQFDFNRAPGRGGIRLLLCSDASIGELGLIR